MTCGMPSFSRPPWAAPHMGAVSASRIAGMYSSRTDDLAVHVSSPLKQCEVVRTGWRCTCQKAAHASAALTAAGAVCPASSSCPVSADVGEHTERIRMLRSSHQPSGKAVEVALAWKYSERLAPAAARASTLATRGKGGHHTRAPQNGSWMDRAGDHSIRHESPALRRGM